MGAFQIHQQQEPFLEREIGIKWIGRLFPQTFAKSGQSQFQQFV
jgi:hypothetical protein